MISIIFALLLLRIRLVYYSVWYDFRL